ncbi:NAD(P)H-dependent oxidoreductase, partial [Staphylococcus aureus]|nr:NAD(P)H-dependent oxidoreductase [Staphylococcus aureus]
QIMRIGRTFAYEDGAFRGLVEGKRAYVAYSYGAGGYGEGGALNSLDFLRPYLTLILNFIGITDVTSFAVEATTADATTV